MPSSRAALALACDIMKHRIYSSLTFIGILVVAACGDGSSTSTGTGGGTGGNGSGGNGSGGTASQGGLPCNVAEILANNCAKCHSSPPVFGAPMPLSTHADLMAPAKSDPASKVVELIGKRIHDAVSPMPPPPNAELSAADQKVLDDWIAQGAPASSENCGGTGTGGGGAGGGGPLGCTPDAELSPAAPYAMPQNVTDNYVCYGVELAYPQKRHITAIVPRVDNSVIVHHMLLYQSDTATSPTPTACSGGGGVGLRLAAVWAPGGEAFKFPPEAGLPIEGSSHYVVQVHYSNLNMLADQKDASGFSLCTTDQLRPNDADILAFGTLNINIPANGKQDLTCNLTIPAGVLQPNTHIIGAMPHMHKLGKTIRTDIFPGGAGNPVLMSERNPWNFDSQYWDSLDVPLKQGDKVTTRCYWENPTNKAVGFGEQTSDEMCFAFAMYYPKIELAQFNWLLPATSAQCGPTP